MKAGLSEKSVLLCIVSFYFNLSDGTGCFGYLCSIQRQCSTSSTISCVFVSITLSNPFFLVFFSPIPFGFLCLANEIETKAPEASFCARSSCSSQPFFYCTFKIMVYPSLAYFSLDACQVSRHGPNVLCCYLNSDLASVY